MKSEDTCMILKIAVFIVAKITYLEICPLAGKPETMGDGKTYTRFLLGF